MGIQRSTIKLLGDTPDKKFAKVPHALLRDTGLTPDAFRVAVYLLSLSDGWEVNQRGMATAVGLPSSNLARVNRAIKNLIERGWLKLAKYHDANERVYKHEYVMNRSRRIANPTGAESRTVTGADSRTLLKDHKNYDAPKEASVERELLNEGSGQPPAGAGKVGSGIEVAGSRDGFPQKNTTATQHTVERLPYDGCWTTLPCLGSESGTPAEEFRAACAVLSDAEHAACIEHLVTTADDGMWMAEDIEPPTPQPFDAYWDCAEYRAMLGVAKELETV